MTFTLLQSEFTQQHLLKVLRKSNHLSGRYRRKQKWVSYWNTLHMREFVVCLWLRIVSLIIGKQMIDWLIDIFIYLLYCCRAARTARIQRTYWRYGIQGREWTSRLPWTRGTTRSNWTSRSSRTRCSWITRSSRTTRTRWISGIFWSTGCSRFTRYPESKHTFL